MAQWVVMLNWPENIDFIVKIGLSRVPKREHRNFMNEIAKMRGSAGAFKSAPIMASMC